MFLPGLIESLCAKAVGAQRTIREATRASAPRTEVLDFASNGLLGVNLTPYFDPEKLKYYLLLPLDSWAALSIDGSLVGKFQHAQEYFQMSLENQRA